MLTFPARRGTPPSYSKLLLADLVKWWNGSYIILLSLEAGKWILPAPIVSLRLYLCTTHLYWPPSLQARHLQKSMKRRPWSHKCIISSPLGPLGNLATEEGAWDLGVLVLFSKKKLQHVKVWFSGTVPTIIQMREFSITRHSTFISLGRRRRSKQGDETGKKGTREGILSLTSLDDPLGVILLNEFLVSSAALNRSIYYSKTRKLSHKAEIVVVKQH